MSILAAGAEVSTSGTNWLAVTLFVGFIAVTMGITLWAGRSNRSAADHYTGGASFSGFQNGLAVAGDYMSAASFLGIAGTIALFGYDGFLYSIGFLVAWLVALLLVAQPLRNSGRFTMGDVLAFRLHRRPVRTAASVSTVVVSTFYLIAQMVGAGALVTLLLGVTGTTAKNLVILLVGALMIFYVVIGGMKGTTWVQIVKAVLLMAGTTLIVLMVLWKFGFSVNHLLGQAAETSGKGAAFLEPGQRFGKVVPGDGTQTMWNKIDLISLGLALVLGTAGLPHILIRFYTVPTAKEARKSVNWAITNIGVFYLMTIGLGFGAAALVSRTTLLRGFKTDAAGCFVDAKGAPLGGSCLTDLGAIPADLKTALVPVDPSGNVAAPLLAKVLGQEFAGETGGTILLAVIAAVAFATILAVVAGLTLAASSSFAHDFYANVLRHGRTTEKQEIRVAKTAAVAIGAVSIVLAIYAQSFNVAFLVALAFAVAASANLPAVLLSLFWRRFTTRGAVWAIYGGLGMALFLLVFSKNVSGATTALFPEQDFAWFPLNNPGLISIPFGFLMGVLGSLLGRDKQSEELYPELEVRSLTGAAAHGATAH